MEKIALFRYHAHAEVCKNHLQIFRRYNPDIPIYGLYGGTPEEFGHYSRELDLDGNYQPEGIDEEWKWKNFDFILSLWYEQFGKDIAFTQLYIVEWDFILFDSIEHAYKDIPVGTVGLTGFVDLSRIEDKWYWTKHPPKQMEWQQLKEYINQTYSYTGKFYASLCPGLTVPRKYLEGMSGIKLPDLGNDELRFPIYVQLQNLPVKDTGFYKKWFSKKEMKVFNCNGKDISADTIRKHLKKKKGRRAFHPFREVFSGEDLTGPF